MKLHKLLIIIIPFFCLTVNSNNDNKKENIIFIIVDDLRDLAMADNQLQISTPNIDKLKKRGVTFKNSFTNNPVCGASRASLLTGLRPTKSRFTTFYTKINEDTPNSLTIASHLKNNGYKTISNGKISHHARDAAYGWDDIFRGSRNNPKDYKDPINIKNLKNNFGPASEFVYTDDNDYSDGKVAQKTIRDIRSINQSDMPFFIAVGFQKPHLPFVAPKKYWDLYDRNDIVLPFNNFFPPNAPQKANYFYELRKFTDVPEKGAISDDKAKELIHAYYACVSYIDAQIGLILDELNNQDLTNNTTVVLTSDHGFSLSEHGRWTKHNLFQYELKIPMIISSPKYKKNKTSESFVELVDLYPTFCDLADIETPKFVHGKSLVSNLKMPNKVTNEIAFSIWKNGETLISNKYYYTEWKRKGSVTDRMLYDIENDELQMNNIAEIRSNKSIVDSLSQILNKHIMSKN
jgi:arylsulfatase A-like enzyme